ncbi:MAG: magnetosome biogenesis CDF transporter MamM [Nitrospirae bacterium]|uniref:Magnetosome protein MamM n=1 Tax=uncultured Nitrospirota bacterium TaxID=170969 RepID=A0A142BTV0_9BACT|nr:magnetosome protein MamM [uncultured Nitrospirota bacterium]MBF0328608.1 magnetosome biogenesis CDF transporter MamM [Nitrospirota bacterium]
MHKLPQTNLNYLECKTCEKKAGWIAVFSNLGLAVFKLIVGILSGSKAVIGDALYSFKDFFIALVVLAGIRISGKPPDENHPYGHGKIEFVAIFFISLLIIIGTFFLFIHSVKDVWMVIQGISTPHPKFIAFWAAIISVVANYKLANYLHCVGERVQSPAMLANAKHNHSDAVSSAFVAVAVLLTSFGWYIVDPLVAVIETVDLIMLCVNMMKDTMKSLLDSSLDSSIMKQIESTAQLVPGVRKVSSLTARKTGQSIWIDMIIKIDPRHTLDNGYKISRQVEDTLMKRIRGIGGVHIAVEPYTP